mmetsp:Transcript_15617/g.41947  ORF Transcript_15617/g.41947 Transcript_15617/m.41947 type:complete len:908 (-) Transcript_15617:121-2844(-)
MTSFNHIVDEFFRSKFEAWGRLVTRNPIKVALTVLILYVALCAGILTLNPENQSTQLWVPTQSKGYQDREFIEHTFGEEAPALIAYVTRNDGGNMFSFGTLKQLIRVHKETTKRVKAVHQGEEVGWKDVCKKYDDKPNGCASQNFLRLWNYREDVLADNRDSIDDAINALHKSASVELFAGGVKYEDEDEEEVESVKAVSFVYELNSSDVTSAAYSFQGAWNEAMLNLAAEYSDDLEITFFNDRSFDDEVGRLVSGDIPLFASGMVVIVIYLALTLGNPRSLSKGRVLLGSFAVINVLLACGAGFGVASLAGVRFPPIVPLLPLILLGVQVDGVIIMVDNLNAEDPRDALEDRVGRSFGKSGPAILITSLTAIAAFSVGVTTDLPAVSMFCAFAASSFTFAMIVIFTLFLALLVLDERRVMAGGVSFIPCIKVSQCGTCAASEAAQGQERAAAASSVTKAGAHAAPADPPLGHIQRFVRDHYAPTLLRAPVSIVVVIVFIALAVLSGLSIPLITVGQPETDVLPDDSYVQDALRVEKESFGGRIAVTALVVTNEDFSRKRTLDNLDEAIEAVEDIDVDLISVTSRLPGGWVDEYKDHLKTVSTPPEDDYLLKLGDFLDKDRNVGLRENVNCTDTSCKQLFASRSYVSFPSGTGDAIEALFQRDIIETELKKKGFQDAFAYNQDMMFGEADALIWGLTLTNMGVALIAIFIIMLFFSPPLIAFWITVIVALIDLDLLGAMYISGVALNTVTFVNLVMAVGLAVDYCVHIAHTFDSIYNERVTNSAMDQVVDTKQVVIEAMTTMGTSVVKGGFTTFLGVCVIAFANSVAFRTFFTMISFTVALALVHGLVLLPIILAYVGVPSCLGIGKATSCTPRRVSVVSANDLSFSVSTASSEEAGPSGPANSANP